MIADTNPIASPTQSLRQKLAILETLMSEEQRDTMVEGVAEQTRASLVQDTPKRWFGQAQKGWQVIKTGPAERTVLNDATVSNGAPLMLLLEEGTANNGTGYIYPKEKKNLYIPLKAIAVKWHNGLKYGVDYILRKRVKGQKGQHIVANERPRAAARLLGGYKRLVAQALDKCEVRHG